MPLPAARLAFSRYENLRHKIRNDSHLSIIDFTRHSKEARLFVINTTSGSIDAIHVAHGSGTDPDNDGMGEYFSNVPNSHKSSLGAFLVSERYVGKYGASMRMDGLEASNDLARARAIVLHPSKYVYDGKEKQGRSWGCPAVPYAIITSLIDRLRDGSLLFAYGQNQGNSALDALAIERILMDPAFGWLDEGEGAPIEGE